MTRLYFLVITALLAGTALAQEIDPQQPVPQSVAPLWLLIAAGVGALALVALVIVALALKKSKPRPALPPEEKTAAPAHPRKQIENPITLKQQKPDAD